MLAPIVLFVYNRPWHTRQTLESLAANFLAGESRLIVYADGPKPDASEAERSAITEIRNIVSERLWCREVEIITSDYNLGLAPSVIKGVTEVLRSYGKAIIMEDDLVTSPWFLTYLNDCLELYKDADNIYSVNGFMFPVKNYRTCSVLLPFTSTWGWATWKEKWALFDFEMVQKEQIVRNRFLKARFNLADYDYSAMLGYNNNSWGIKWYYSVFVRNGLSVFPTKSLVQNIGFDGSGINYTEKVKLEQELATERIPAETGMKVDLDFLSLYLNYFEIKQPNTLKKRIKSFLRRSLNLRGSPKK